MSARPVKRTVGERSPGGLHQGRSAGGQHRPQGRATQDKAWLTGPGGERWEVHTVLADDDAFGNSPQALIDAGQAPESGVCCGTAQNPADQPATGTADDPQPAASAAACC
ncbi:hypothetical protein [Blastococcus sp. SYSU DS0973]